MVETEARSNRSLAWETRSVAGKISRYAVCWEVVVSELTAGPGVVFSVTRSGFTVLCNHILVAVPEVVLTFWVFLVFFSKHGLVASSGA